MQKRETAPMAVTRYATRVQNISEELVFHKALHGNIAFYLEQCYFHSLEPFIRVFKILIFLSEKTHFVPYCMVWSLDIRDGVNRSQDSVDIVMTRLRAGRPRNRGSVPGKVKVFLSSSTIQTCPLAHPAIY